MGPFVRHNTNSFINTLHRTLRSDVLVTRGLRHKGAGDWRARLRAKPFRTIRFRRVARPLFEAGPPRGYFPPNDSKLVGDEQTRAFEKAASTDIVPYVIRVSSEEGWGQISRSHFHRTADSISLSARQRITDGGVWSRDI